MLYHNLTTKPNITGEKAVLQLTSFIVTFYWFKLHLQISFIRRNTKLNFYGNSPLTVYFSGETRFLVHLTPLSPAGCLLNMRMASHNPTDGNPTNCTTVLHCPWYDGDVNNWNKLKTSNHLPASKFCHWFQVRLVSNRILSTADADIESDREFTFMLTIFGQWVDHDLTLTPTSPSIRSFSNGLNCDESCERSEPCFPIQVSQEFSFLTLSILLRYNIYM